MSPNFLPRNTTVFAERVNFGRRVRLHMSFPDPQRVDGVVVVQPAIFKTMDAHDVGLENHEPMLEMRVEAAQTLMDELYRAGFRPSAGEISGDERAALKAHLADMRILTAHVTKAPLRETELKPNF